VDASTPVTVVCNPLLASLASSRVAQALPASTSLATVTTVASEKQAEVAAVGTVVPDLQLGPCAHLGTAPGDCATVAEPQAHADAVAVQLQLVARVDETDRDHVRAAGDDDGSATDDAAVGPGNGDDDEHCEDLAARAATFLRGRDQMLRAPSMDEVAEEVCAFFSERDIFTVDEGATESVSPTPSPSPTDAVPSPAPTTQSLPHPPIPSPPPVRTPQRKQSDALHPVPTSPQLAAVAGGCLSVCITVSPC
jgi:hypothetical protein